MGKLGKVIAVAAVSAITISSGGTLGFAFAKFATSLVLGGISHALSSKLSKKPKSDVDSSFGAKGQTVTVRQSDIPRTFVYGHNRITSGYAHIYSTGVNGILHLIVILCDGPVRAINEIWMDDYCIPSDHIDENGNVIQGRFAGYLKIKKHLGSTTQEADPLAITNIPGWTSDHRLQGIAYLYIVMTKNQDIFPTGLPNPSAIVEGKEIYDPRIEEQAWSPNIPLVANDFIRDMAYGFGADADQTDDLNVAAQANIADEIVEVEAEVFTIASATPATNILTLDGTLLKLQFADRVVVEGSSLPSGLAEDTYYYVIPYQVKDTPRILLANSLDNAIKKIPVDFTTAGSGTMTLTKNGEPRYHGAGVVDTSSNLSNTLGDIVTAMGGRAISIAGNWSLLAGAWRTPVADLYLDDLMGPIAFKSNLSMSESYNVVKGLFISSVNLYQKSDYPSRIYQRFVDDDKGRLSPKTMDQAFQNRPTACQRIAKMETFRGRQGIVFTAEFSIAKAIELTPGDNVTITLDHLGWDHKPFEITGYSLLFKNNALTVRLDLRETAQAIFDWSQGEAVDYDPAPNTNLPNPFTVTVPTGVAYNSRLATTEAGDNLYIMQMQWDLHVDAYVRERGTYQCYYQKVGETEWIASAPEDGKSTRSDLFSAEFGVAYNLRMQAVNSLGVRSAFVVIENAIVGGSGGVTESDDWGLFNDTPTETDDWGSFNDDPTETDDWGFM